jgi:hypothetical protein
MASLIRRNIMPTRKTIASKVASASPLKTPRKSRRGSKARSIPHAAAQALGGARRSVARGFDFPKYVTPGAAVLASGALAAVGYAFKDQIGEMMAHALTASAKSGRKAVDVTRDRAMDAVETISEKVSLESLLRLAGLQKKSTLASILGPAIGVACGLVAGSALTYFFGPKLLEQLKEEAEHGSATSGDEAPSAMPASESSPDRARANGGMGVS